MLNAYPRKKGRKPISEAFPREEIIHDIPEEDKICQCGRQLTKIGEVVSKKLDIIPQKITVKRHIRPKYAQNKMFERLGIDISRSTMSSWAIQAAQKCEPLLELFHKKLRDDNIINIDETQTQVLGESGRKNRIKSYMWVAKGGTEEIVGDFHGFLQSDGYSEYNEL